MATMPPLTHGKVVGRFAAYIGDQMDDEDELPEAVALQGEITFTPNISFVKVAGASPGPATVAVRPVVCDLDTDGFLSRNGVAGVWLLANNAPGVPDGFQWRVSFSLTLEGVPIAMEAFSIYLPAGTSAQALDLTLAAPVPTNPAQDLTGWAAAVAVVQGYAAQALAAVEASGRLVVLDPLQPEPDAEDVPDHTLIVRKVTA